MEKSVPNCILINNENIIDKKPAKIPKIKNNIPIFL
jgi:hypothetical protein